MEVLTFQPVAKYAGMSLGLADFLQVRLVKECNLECYLHELCHIFVCFLYLLATQIKHKSFHLNHLIIKSFIGTV